MSLRSNRDSSILRAAFSSSSLILYWRNAARSKMSTTSRAWSSWDHSNKFLLARLEFLERLENSVPTPLSARMYSWSLSVESCLYRSGVVCCRLGIGVVESKRQRLCSVRGRGSERSQRVEVLGQLGEKLLAAREELRAFARLLTHRSAGGNGGQ